MKAKILTLVLAISLPVCYVAIASAQTAGTTAPTTDFGRDVTNGINSTKNDAVAKQEQQAVKDNESDGAAEDGAKTEVKEAAEVPEAPEAKEAAKAKEAPEASDSNSSSEKSGETKKSDSGSGTGTGGATVKPNSND